MQQLPLTFDVRCSSPLQQSHQTSLLKPSGNRHGFSFDYQIIHSKRRSLAITVHQATVTVRAPQRAAASWVNGFIIEKSAWIEKQLETQQQQLSQIYRIVDRATIFILDKKHTINISRLGSNSTCKQPQIYVEHAEQILHVVLTSNKLLTDEAQATQLFFKWIKIQASGYMPAKTAEFAARIKLGKQLNKINFRRTRSKWGHCTSEGNIQYNPLIMLAPEYVVDYIIAHEVCHLRHRNHSKLFWQLVEKHYPHYKDAERWLKNNGHKLAIEIPKQA